MITSIDDMNVNISYTLKRKKYIIKETLFNINLTKINLYNKFDEGVLPELDIIFK